MSATPTPESGPADTLPLMSELVTAPSFRIAFRGYDLREVDRWAKVMEAQVEAAKVAHRELAADVRSLADQLDRAHEELVVLRRRPNVDDAVTFRHLGPRVEQILAEAHAEAEVILRSANATAGELRERTEEQLGTTREQHARAVAEFEEHRRWLQEEELRWSRLLHSRQEGVARADEYRRRVRRDAEELLEAATTQHERLVASGLARTEHMLKEASAQAAAIREAAHRAAGDELARARQAVAEQRLAGGAEAGEPPREPAAPERDEAVAAEAAGSAEPGQPAVGTAAVGTAGPPEPARGVAKVVYVVNPGEPEADEAAPAEARRSTVDAR